MEWAKMAMDLVIAWSDWFIDAAFMTILLALVSASVFFETNFLEEWLNYEEE